MLAIINNTGTNKAGGNGDKMSGALAGIRVVDFGQFIAGPLAAMLLADQGAEVLHVDPPGGPMLQTPANATWNRGKTCVEIDLKSETGRARALRLIGQADIVIENFRPGRMASLGLGAEALMARDQRLIYCSLPGFATDDPRADLPGWEGVIGAATDTYRPVPGGALDRPVYLGIPVASNFAAFHAATACVMALIARQRDGLGQRIEVPLYDAMFSAIGARGMALPGGPGAPLDTTGFGIYVCKDGRCVHFAPVAPRFMEWFAAAAGIEAWREEGLFNREQLQRNPALLAKLRARLTALFVTLDAEEWERLVNAAGAPLAVCRSMAEWLHTPHARASGAIVECDDPVHGTMLQPGPPVRLSATPGAVSPRRMGGEHYLNTIWPAQPTPPPLTEIPSQLPALSGLRVLDLTQVWAGPTAARLLAEYGADVIKINSPHEPVMTHQDVNRGKRTILLDLATQDGQAVFWRLAAGADVIMQNFAKGVAERLGIGPEDVHRRRPDIIYASVSCYGYDGPWGGRRGYEVQGQAVAGAQVQFGGSQQAARLPYEINDYGTGILAAFATSLALFHRTRSGQGQRVEAALAYTATLHQSLYLNDFAGKSWGEPSGPEALGSGPLQRLYRASDAWFFLGARESDVPRLRAVPGLHEMPELDDPEFGAMLEGRFAAASADIWVRHLVAAGLGAHKLTHVEDVMRDPWAVAHGLSLTREHQGVGMVRTIGPVPRLSRTKLVAGRPVPPPGGDGAEIRREMGLLPQTAA